MIDWETIEPDVIKRVPVHYTKGRGGKSVEFIGIHYNAGNLTTEGCYNVWLTREASAHYQVEDSGRIGQLVWDRDTAWALGNFDKNQRSINIEHANRPDGTITDECLDNGAHLVAALCKMYDLGRPEWLVNVYPHSYFMATSCPGQIYGSQKSAYIERAQWWYDDMMGHHKKEEDMTTDQENMLREIYNQVTRTDDPTGRNQNFNDHDPIKFIAQAIQAGFAEVTEQIAAFTEELKKLNDKKEDADE